MNGKLKPNFYYFQLFWFLFHLQFLVQLPKAWWNTKYLASQHSHYVYNQQYYCWKLNSSPDLNSFVNNNNGHFSYTGSVEILKSVCFIIPQLVKPETGVDTQNKNIENVDKIWRYWGFKCFQIFDKLWTQ